MRARYYSPELRRFINSDIIAGSIVNAITLNRYAYANGNPVSFVDPLGLSVEEKGAFAKLSDLRNNTKNSVNKLGDKISNAYTEFIEYLDDFKSFDEIYSLYDNHRDGYYWNRYIRKKGYVFREKFLSAKFTEPYLSFSDELKLKAGAEFDLISGGWQGKDFDISLLDFGHAEAYISAPSNKDTKLECFISAWSPSVEFKIKDVTIELELEVGAIGFGGGHEITKNSISYSKVFNGGGFNVGYSLFVAIPSVTFNILDRNDKLPYDNYYSAPWEYGANIYGDVQNAKMTNYDSWTEEVYTIYDPLVTMLSFPSKALTTSVAGHI